tara:strand:+ start:112 stop:327 length:216 start_codon:yes stop_codon:yes gene_type:complete
MQDKIEKLINENIPDAICIFEGDACNLKLTIVSQEFKDLSLINQHRKVLKLLESDFESGELHALSLETRIN